MEKHFFLLTDSCCLDHCSSPPAQRKAEMMQKCTMHIAIHACIAMQMGQHVNRVRGAEHSPQSPEPPLM